MYEIISKWPHDVLLLGYYRAIKVVLLTNKIKTTEMKCLL